MAKISCFSLIVKKKKKVKGDDESSRAGEMDKAIRTLHIRLQQQPVKPVEVNGLKPVKTFGAFIPYGVDNKPIKNDKVKTPDSPVGLCEAAYEAEDEHDESPNNNPNDSDRSFPNRGHKSGAIASVGQKSMSKSKSLAKV